MIPARDTYATHSTALARGENFRLFRPERPVTHRFFLGHNAYLAISGDTTIDVQFSLTPAGSKALTHHVGALRWHSAGTAWRSQTATNGLKRSGTVRLVSAAGTAAMTSVNGADTYWIRGTLNDPLPPDHSRIFAMADQIKVSCDIKRPLRWDVIRVDQTPKGPVKEMGAVGDILPDQAYSNGAKLDLTQSFYPLGKSPDRNSAFYFTNAEVFSKPGAEVVIAYRKALTPEEQADILAAAELVDKATQQILKTVRDMAQVAVNLAQSVLPIVVQTQEMDPTELAQRLAAFHGALNNLKLHQRSARSRAAAGDLYDAIAQLQSDWNLDWGYFDKSIMKAANDSSGLLGDLHDLVAVPIAPAYLNFVVNAAANAAWVLAVLSCDLYNDSDHDDGFDELLTAINNYQAQSGVLKTVAGIDSTNAVVGRWWTRWATHPATTIRWCRRSTPRRRTRSRASGMRSIPWSS